MLDQNLRRGQCGIATVEPLHEQFRIAFNALAHCI